MSINLDLKEILTRSYDTYYSKTDNGIIQLNRQKIEDLPKHERQIFQKNYPDLYQLLRDCTANITITQKKEKMNTPALGQLNMMVAYYGKKYGIKIRLCHESEVNPLLEKLYQYQNFKPMGFILVSDDYSHVTPFIFHAREGKYELLIMDSTGIKGTKQAPCEHLMRIPVPPTSRRMLAEGTRQADYGSCNTEAAILLRNALIHIAYLDLRKAFTSLENLIKPQYEEENNLICYLPAQWIYIDHITSTISPDEWQRTCIKQFVSKNDLLNMLQVQNRWRGYIISTVAIEGIPENLEEEMLNITSKYPDINRVNRGLTFSTEKSVNEYLSKKSQLSRFLKNLF